jgi:hypothetical protein
MIPARASELDRMQPPMASTTELRRAPSRFAPGRDRSARDVLGHPAAFVATAAILLMLFGWTFVTNPGRTAPTRDPAFYTWRTGALLHEEPRTLLDVEGPFGLYSGGYRVSVPTIGAAFSQVADIEPRSAVALLMVLAPVLTSLLLAGFAYRYRPDPLMWHTVAFTSAGLLLTPPFVGYLDNLLGMFFLAGALWFLGPSRASWRGRAGLALFLIVMGVTHTTTLAIFALTLGCMTVARFLFGRFEVSGTLARARAALVYDAPMLVIAALAAISTYFVWTAGVWEVSTTLSESALVFPYDPGFFFARLLEWVVAMRLWFNGPLMIVGAVGLLAVGRRWVEDDLARVSIVWLAPLVGVLGFLGALEYPYYRFFNTTLAWVLLIGVGAYSMLRFFMERADTAAVGRWAYAGVVAVVVILVTNLSSGFVLSNWNDPKRGWLTNKKKQELDLLRANLAAMAQLERPVVFVMDVRPPEVETLAQSWGITQVNGNTARYGLPPGQVEWGLMYQGTIANLLRGRPTITGNAAYDKLARESWNVVEEGLGSEGRNAITSGDPLVVLASTLNENGPNAPVAAGEEPLPQTGAPADVWVLREDAIEVAGGDTRPMYATGADVPPVRDAGALHLLWAALAVALLAVPGVLATRWFLPEADLPQLLAMGPTLSLLFTVALVTGLLAVLRSPFSDGVALAYVALSFAVGVGLVLAARRSRRALTTAG